MKKLLYILFLVLASLSISAQDQPSIDKEKLFNLYETQKYGEAAIYLRSVYGDDVNDFKAITQIAYCYLMSNNNPEAEKFYTKAYQQQQQNLPVLFSLASINTKRGNIEKAKFYYHEIIKIDRNNFNVLKLLANLYPSKDSLKSVYLIRANKINSQESDVAYDLAELYSQYQQYEKAYEVLNMAIIADTGNLILQKAVLPIANSLKKYNEVILSGEKILKADADPLVIKDVARAYYYTKNYPKAISMFKLLEAKNMQNESTLYFTSLSYRAIKNHPLATTYTEKTIDEGISTNTANYYALLGLIYEESDKFVLAKAAYKKGLEYKLIPNIYYRLAIMYDTKLKQVKNAQKYYNLYLKSKPDKEADKKEIEYVRSRIEQIKLTD